MHEPQLSEFIRLVRSGAGARDIFTAQDEFSPEGEAASESFIRKEIERVQLHQRSLVPVLERRVGPAPRILDVGCSSGGTTVALALSPMLNAEEVIGVDPNDRSLAAARVRALGHDLPERLVHFEHVDAGAPMAFADDSFDLVVCVSVVEFVTLPAARRLLLEEIRRVTRPGGHAYIATPNPYVLRELHSRRLFGNQRRSPTYPWASRATEIRQAFFGWTNVDLGEEEYLRIRARLNLPLPHARPLISLATRLMPWQRLLLRKPFGSSRRDH